MNLDKKLELNINRIFVGEEGLPEEYLVRVRIVQSINKKIDKNFNGKNRNLVGNWNNIGLYYRIEEK